MLILDTHALVWWVEGDPKLSAPAVQAIKPLMKQPGSLLVSSIFSLENCPIDGEGKAKIESLFGRAAGFGVTAPGSTLRPGG